MIAKTLLRAAFATLVLAAINPASAAITCNAQFGSAGNVQWRNGEDYDPLHPATLTHDETFTATSNANPADCQFMIVVTAVGGGNLLSATSTTGDTLQIDIGAPGGPGMPPSSGIAASAPVGFTIPLNQFVRAGDYKADFDVSIYDITGGGSTLVRQKTFRIRVGVEARTEISFSSGDWTDNTKTLTFADMRKGSAVSTPVFVRANTGYELTLQSKNGGALKNMTSGSTTILMEYKTTLDDVPITLGNDGAGGTSTPFANTGTSFAPQQHDLTFTLDSPRAIAGQYRDEVTIIVQSLQ
jgi:hypothetical protein